LAQIPFLGFARFFTHTGQFGGFFFSSLASLWPKFTSPRFRMFEDFAFRLDCLPDIRASNNVFLRTQIFFGSVRSGHSQQLEKFACAARIDEQFVKPTYEAQRIDRSRCRFAAKRKGPQ
jgi:hypothetical protein